MHDGISDPAMANGPGLQYGLVDVLRGLVPYVEHVKRVQDSLLVASAAYDAAFTLQQVHVTACGCINHLNFKLCTSL